MKDERAPGRTALYMPAAAVLFLYVFYLLAMNFFVDPGAETFRSHKTDLGRPLDESVWVKVMGVHVAFACVAIGTGFVNVFSRNHATNRKVHRLNGYAYVIAVLVVVLTSGYMAPYATGGKISSIGFNALNMIWLFVTAMALIHIYKKRMLLHRKWMIRSYVFCFTNLSIHLLTFALHRVFGVDYVASYTAGLYGTIALLLLAPEALFRLRKNRSA